MQIPTIRRAASLAAAGLLVLCLSAPARADTVLAGWDLFQSTVGTEFMGIPFAGVPIGTSFTFPPTNPEGNPIVPPNPNLGATDTIIERLSNVTAAPGGSGTTQLAMQDLQLMTTMAVPAGTFGAGTPGGIYYLTLQSMRSAAEGGPGPASTGSMTINFANPTPGPPPPAQPIGGTFSSSLDVFFDLRLGSLTGPIEASENLVLTNGGTTGPIIRYPAMCRSPT